MSNASTTIAVEPSYYFEDYQPGLEFVTAGRTVTDADIRMYLGATGTDHPNHSDEEYCRAHPLLKGVCAPGVLVLGFVDAGVASRVTRYMAASMNYGHERIRYLKPVYVGDTIHSVVKVVDCAERDQDWGLVRLEATAYNQAGEPVLFDAHVLVVQRLSGPSKSAS